MVADLLLPGILILCALAGLRKKVDVYDAMTSGAMEGLHMLVRIFPSLLVLLSAIAMLRASGALDALARLCAPLFSHLGIPPELLPLMVIRPFSGSAALAVGAELMKTYGVDSQIGRTAAVMLGSTETTFYTITVYFGAAKLKGTRHTIPAALAADLTGFLTASIFTKVFFS